MLTEFDVVTGGRKWSLNKEQQDIILGALGTIPVDSYIFGGNDMSQARAVEVLGAAGYQIKSPRQLDDDATAAAKAKSDMPTSREATEVSEVQPTMAEMRAEMKALRDDFDDMKQERDDIKAGAGRPIECHRQSVPSPTNEPTEWTCPRCGDTGIPWSQDECQCGKIRIGSPSSPSVAADFDQGHPARDPATKVQA